MVLSAVSTDDVGRIASHVYGDVFRRDFMGLGFALIQFDDVPASSAFRRHMIALHRELDSLVLAARGERLRFQSLARFDQQTTTKFHLDGGPDESILMLGYEPTGVKSSVALADYTRAAHDLGLSPQEFMDRHNPMFGPGEKLLANYIHPLTEFDAARFQIVFINNSRLPWTSNCEHSLGVLHQATILNPDPGQSRVINSTMLAVVPPNASEVVTEHDMNHFATTNDVARKNYTN